MTPSPAPEQGFSPAREWHQVAREKPSAIALGNFDGVHLGHRRILEALREKALAEGVEPIALTFEPHPRQFLFPESKTSLLTSPREKAALIAALGIELVTLTFDAGFAALSAEAFVTDVLVKRLRGAHFFLGDNHRFGKGARGDISLLRALVNESGQGGRVNEIPPVLDQGEIVSSSVIRHHLKDGNVARAAALLGRSYSLRGTVVRGAARGRELGFPTANLRVEDPRKILPFGVYGGVAKFGDGARGGMPVSAVANIGLRPTFSGPEPSVEVHLLDWDGDLYGRELEFELREHLRPERRFDSIEALRDQIRRDVAAWRLASPAPLP
jgi:riboflavin kinase/FMN adenylyltransferase